MSFLNQIDFNNLFNEDTYVNAVIDGPYSIRIAPTRGRVESQQKDVEIVGILKNSVQFGASADWETFGLQEMVSNITSNNGILKSISTGIGMMNKASGRSLTDSGLVTRKFYKGGGTYLSINPEFRILDWENTGETWKTLLTIIAYTLPRKTPQSFNIKDVLDSLKAENPDSWFTAAVQWLQNNNRNINEGLMGKDLGGAITNMEERGFEELAGGDVNLTESPSPVTVSIGNWFRHDDMVVEDVSFTMSEQMTDVGPLYMDVSMKLSSRETMVLTPDGIEKFKVGNNKGKGRITNLVNGV